MITLFKNFTNESYECWNCAQLFKLRLDSHHPNTHFPGNVLVSHNPSVYVPVITKLPRFDYHSLIQSVILC
jgi:hypothetical protein